MKEIAIITNLVYALMLIIVLIYIIRGIIILIKGKCKIRKYKVNGKVAKSIGLAFLLVPIILIAINAVMYESFNWGRSGTTGALFVSPIVQSIVYAVGLIIVHFWALSKAKAFQKSE